MKTYIIVMQQTINGSVYCKVGKTKDIEKRLRIYQLHNPSITDVLIIDKDIEDDILFDNRWIRMQNESGRDNEWLDFTNEPYICEHFIEYYGFKSYYRTFINGDTEQSRLTAYEQEKFLDLSNL